MRLGTSLNHGITCYLETPDAMVIFCDPIKIRSMMFCRCLYLRVSETSKKNNPRVLLLVLVRAYLHQYTSIIFNYHIPMIIHSCSIIVIAGQLNLLAK